MAVESTKSRKRVKKVLIEAMVHIKASFNNTIITVTDLRGNVFNWSSAAKAGFKGSRKSTPFAAQVATDGLLRECKEKHKLEKIHIKVKGPGPGRESSMRAVGALGLIILSIEDVTGMPHNGCRDRKKKRN